MIETFWQLVGIIAFCLLVVGVTFVFEWIKKGGQR